MATTRASKLISLTILATGNPIYLSANKIIWFQASGSNSRVKYIDDKDTVQKKIFTESVSTIFAATSTGSGNTMQAITLNNTASTVRYIQNDRIIYIDSVSTSGNVALVTYDSERSEPSIYKVKSPNAASINAATENTFVITTQPTSAGVPSKTRYINNLLIDKVVNEPVGSLPTLAATYKIKLETVALTVQGSGYTAATVAFSGGGTGAVLPTATATVAAGAVTQITINTAGSNITDDVLVTINGDGTGATCVAKIHHILDTLTIVNAGSNLNTAPTVTFSSGTVTATSTITVSASTQKATATSITNVGSYIATAFPPTITIAGGNGASIMYDEKHAAFVRLQVEETSAQVAAAVNAL